MADDQVLPTLEELDELDADMRQQLYDEALSAIQALSERLFGTGLTRLEAISDEEWDAAVQASEEEP